MRPRSSVRFGRYVLLASAVAAAPPVSAQGARRAALTMRDAAVVERAREGAARRLEDAECRKVFSDFHDAQGRTIESSLGRWEMVPAEYLRTVPFVDGSGEPLCHRGKVMLVSTPNVPRVVVCPGFAGVQRSDPGFAESLVIHELLHTLGLGENPPSSAEITERVQARCR
jgi:hypothetical protein